jgi:hypothetical protein
MDSANDIFDFHIPAGRDAPAGYLNYTNAGGEKGDGGGLSCNY